MRLTTGDSRVQQYYSITKVRDEGKLACANGVPITENPYRDCRDQRSQLWEAGWRDHARLRKKVFNEDIEVAPRSPIDPGSPYYNKGWLARANNKPVSSNPYVNLSEKAKQEWEAGWNDLNDYRRGAAPFQNTKNLSNSAHWPFEVVICSAGVVRRRVQTSTFIWAGILSISLGFMLVANGFDAGFILILTIGPLLLLYPGVRALLGGRDGLLPALVTFLVEELIKNKVFSWLDDKHSRRR